MDNKLNICIYRYNVIKMFYLYMKGCRWTRVLYYNSPLIKVSTNIHKYQIMLWEMIGKLL